MTVPGADGDGDRSTADLAADVRDFWDVRRESFGGMLSLAEEATGPFREHPVWLGAVAGLLQDPAPGRSLRRVADLGTGTGEIAEVLARLGHHVIAVDIAERRVADARERLAPYRHTEVRVGDALDPPLEVGEVDAVVSRNMLWLLPDPVGAASRWAELVGPGGRVAGIDSTHRLSRHRAAALQDLAGLVGRRGGEVYPGSPVDQDRPTFFADVPSAAAAGTVWRSAGLVDVVAADLSWVSAARMAHWGTRRRWLRRDRYFALLGDARGPIAPYRSQVDPLNA